MATPNPWARWLESLAGGGEGARAWEGWLSQQLDKLVRNEAFLGQMGKLMGDSFEVKAQMDRLMEQSLHSMRLPTLGDLEGLHKRLDAVDRRLDDLEERTAGGPDPRLDAIVDRIEEVAGEVEAIKSALPKPRRRPSKASRPDREEDA